MTNNQTISIFIGLLLYLVGLAIFLNYSGHQLNVQYESAGYKVCSNAACTEKTFIGNIVTAIDSFPAWLNTIFIIIPLTLLIWGAILLILHG